VTRQSIFVVEDDAIIALRDSELLTTSGYTVPYIFASGEELLAHLERSDPPDLILMDVGLEREDRWYRDCPEGTHLF